MGFISKTLKKGFFWSYPRTSWQWDVLCVLILVFIFLTPKSWFENSEFQRGRVVQNATHQAVVVTTEAARAQLDKDEITRRVRAITGRPDAEVLDMHEQRDPAGNVIGYKVDIR
jgi:hypothetical protein